MKRLFIVMLVVGLLPLTANAEAKKGSLDSGHDGQPDTDSCGLGWQVTQKKTMLATSTRGTTNGFVPPTFGMTTGTIGCAQHSIAKNDVDAARYAFNNYESLTMEMAQGSGEYLSAFAHTLGCSAGVQSEFGRMTQDNYSAIMGNAQTTAVEMFQNVKAQVKQNAVLASNCRA